MTNYPSFNTATCTTASPSMMNSMNASDQEAVPLLHLLGQGGLFQASERSLASQQQSQQSPSNAQLLPVVNSILAEALALIDDDDFDMFSLEEVSYAGSGVQDHSS
ncbi:expressed unknown protein [Seminavis robusta]|uniref:Uncharacterized protein n=1 Tax=Seminavis robusta TaxID=568900 RepID=A0A9N8DF82_9STRA|nr:expressed unknown protein [Seminavis robusta]|eukprot:Sro121_g058820.1 n/a (106) ;mRNA; r:40415-40732